MTGLSPHYDRQGEPRAGGVRFRDTDPRPVATTPDERDTHDAVYGGYRCEACGRRIELVHVKGVDGGRWVHA